MLVLTVPQRPDRKRMGDRLMQDPAGQGAHLREGRAIRQPAPVALERNIQPLETAEAEEAPAHPARMELPRPEQAAITAAVAAGLAAPGLEALEIQ